MDRSVQTSSYEETLELGKRIGAVLRGGDVICLKGNLGAGKTAFAKGVGLGMGVQEPITSPTFTLIQEYPAIKEGRSLRLVHMDLYRLRQPEEAEIIGVGDFFQVPNVCLIEWPEIADYLLPPDHLQVTIEGQGDSARTFRFEAWQGDWELRLGHVLGEFPISPAN